MFDINNVGVPGDMMCVYCTRMVEAVTLYGCDHLEPAQGSDNGRNDLLYHNKCIC